MMKMIIADDETIITAGIRKLVDWEAMGIEIVGVYPDGKSALEGMMIHKPDIALLDISMPEMTGVDVLKECNLLGMASKIILISGFQDFEYAKAAIRYGAVDYLLKPVIRDELLNAIGKSLNQLKPKLRAAEGSVEGQMEEYAGLLPLNEGTYLPSYAEIFWEKEEEPQMKKLVRFSVVRFIEEYLEERNQGIVFMKQEDIVIIWKKMGRDEGKAALHAANLLAGRFNPAGRFIRAWNDTADNDTRGWAIIDCMFNISLLYWASEETGDPRFKQIAMLHADTAMEHFIRPDGSVKHIVEFNPETGEAIRSYGGQGYGEGSSWARGQGWAVYGFTISYLRTGKKEYLDTAKKVAHYCIANIPENGILPLDFRQPPEPCYEDSCGACVIAGGLLEIAGCVPEAEREMYRRAAVKILKAIERDRADWTESCDAIVQNCSGAYHDSSHHITMSYADYFFIEAIYKIAGKGILLW